VVRNDLAPADRVAERRRAVALARHFREAEGLSIAQIADRLGRSAATVKAYFYDPTGEKARAVKSRYQGVCRGCGAYTQPAKRERGRLRVLQGVPPGRDPATLDAPKRALTRCVRDAMRAWRARYGPMPSSYDWSRTHARRRGRQALERLDEGDWPAASVVTKVYGTWAAARAAAARQGAARRGSAR
jgi:hypothetical protein